MKIELRMRTEQHAVIYFERAQEEEIRKNLPMKARTLEEALEDFRNSQKPDAASYGKTIYADGKYVGDVWCYCIHEETEPDAMLSYCIFEKEYWNKGVAKGAVALFIDEVKEKFALKHIGAFTYSQNIASIKVLQANEFILRETFTEDGKESYYYQKMLYENSAASSGKQDNIQAQDSSHYHNGAESGKYAERTD